MTSSAENYSDLCRAVRSGDNIEGLIQELSGETSINAIPDKERWSRVESTFRLERIYEEYRKEYVRSKEITNVVEAIIGPARFYLSDQVRLLVLQWGWTNLNELVPKNDCIVLIPVLMAGSVEVAVQERGSDRRTALTFTANSEFVIAGRCALWLAKGSKIVCVALCIGKNKE
ncbi:hypothetical protein V500_00749 [Pseudogymnoascus sp. VKM F-4518 (FW-2643)]|nr:hypothetical protein V500_00749 [Pseudogymnoascus sp. VKM F-4518 (FW-2643)]